MNTKKYIVSAAVVATALMGFASVVVAHNSIAPNDTHDLMQKRMMTTAQPMVLTVTPNGKVLLRGTIEAVGVSALTVRSWAGLWTVNIIDSTKLAPGSDVAQFKVGDWVGVQGTINTGAVLTVDATLVRDWNAPTYNVQKSVPR